MPKATTVYCATCGTHTAFRQLVDQLATQCTICRTVRSTHERVADEANVFTTPDGQDATVVRNDDTTVIFSVDKGEHSGYYVYDKATGFGGIQKR